MIGADDSLAQSIRTGVRALRRTWEALQRLATDAEAGPDAGARAGALVRLACVEAEILSASLVKAHRKLATVVGSSASATVSTPIDITLVSQALAQMRAVTDGLAVYCDTCAGLRMKSTGGNRT